MTYKITAELRVEFEDKYNSTICDVLKSNDIDDEHKLCDGYIAESVELVCKIIEKKIYWIIKDNDFFCCVL